METKKVVLIICEGSSDETALGHFFKMLYQDEQVIIHVEHGDITSKTGINSSNVVKTVGNMIKQHASINKLKNTDFKRIIHIMDTDGTFISPEYVMHGSNKADPYYSISNIITSKVKDIQKRNQNKKSNMIKLYSTNSIWNIPYKAYYMSCNLDHVLYNCLNCTDEEKENHALDFYEKYEEDYQGFIDFICNSSFSVNKSYKESWTFIQNELNSLNRFSNVCLCFKKDLPI